MPSNTSQRSTGSAGRSPGKKAGSGGQSGARGAGRPGRKPVKPITAGRPWGLIALATVVAVVAVGIVGYGAWYSWDSERPLGEKRADQIDGVKNFRKTDKDKLTRTHVPGKVSYFASPPVGGNHNVAWQNCEGDVYLTQIPSEHAVHSLEHGAVWITYRPGLPKKQIDALAERVRGNDYMLMSAYPGLDAPISLQAWGFQLKVEDAGDERIKEFITTFRRKASAEPGAACSGGVTATGSEPQVAPGGQQPPTQGG